MQEEQQEAMDVTLSDFQLGQSQQQELAVRPQPLFKAPKFLMGDEPQLIDQSDKDKARRRKREREEKHNYMEEFRKEQDMIRGVRRDIAADFRGVEEHHRQQAEYAKGEIESLKDQVRQQARYLKESGTSYPDEESLIKIQKLVKGARVDFTTITKLKAINQLRVNLKPIVCVYQDLIGKLTTSKGWPLNIESEQPGKGNLAISRVLTWTEERAQMKIVQHNAPEYDNILRVNQSYVPIIDLNNYAVGLDVHRYSIDAISEVSELKESELMLILGDPKTEKISLDAMTYFDTNTDRAICMEDISTIKTIGDKVVTLFVFFRYNEDEYVCMYFGNNVLQIPSNSAYPENFIIDKWKNVELYLQGAWLENSLRVSVSPDYAASISLVNNPEEENKILRYAKVNTIQSIVSITKEKTELSEPDKIKTHDGADMNNKFSSQKSWIIKSDEPKEIEQVRQITKIPCKESYMTNTILVISNSENIKEICFLNKYSTRLRYCFDILYTRPRIEISPKRTWGYDEVFSDCLTPREYKHITVYGSLFPGLPFNPIEGQKDPLAKQKIIRKLSTWSKYYVAAFSNLYSLWNSFKSFMVKFEHVITLPQISLKDAREVVKAIIKLKAELTFYNREISPVLKEMFRYLGGEQNDDGTGTLLTVLSRDSVSRLLFRRFLTWMTSCDGKITSLSASLESAEMLDIEAFVFNNKDSRYNLQLNVFESIVEIGSLLWKDEYFDYRYHRITEISENLFKKITEAIGANIISGENKEVGKSAHQAIWLLDQRLIAKRDQILGGIKTAEDMAKEFESDVSLNAHNREYAIKTCNNHKVTLQNEFDQVIRLQSALVNELKLNEVVAFINWDTVDFSPNTTLEGKALIVKFLDQLTGINKEEVFGNKGVIKDHIWFTENERRLVEEFNTILKSKLEKLLRGPQVINPVNPISEKFDENMKSQINEGLANVFTHTLESREQPPIVKRTQEFKKPYQITTRGRQQATSGSGKREESIRRASSSRSKSKKKHPIEEAIDF